LITYYYRNDRYSVLFVGNVREKPAPVYNRYNNTYYNTRYILYLLFLRK
jgi:hypothetical protein